MAGSLGVSSIKQLMTTGKLGTISFLQAISTNGFQFGDILAPLNSELFRQSLEQSSRQFHVAMQEGAELDWLDKIDVSKHAFDCAKDIATEGKLAIKKIKEQVKKKPKTA